MIWNNELWRRPDGSIRTAKINDEIARQIYLAEGKIEEIAKKFNMSVNAVRNVRRRKSWRRATEGLVR